MKRTSMIVSILTGVLVAGTAFAGSPGHQNKPINTHYSKQVPINLVINNMTKSDNLQLIDQSAVVAILSHGSNLIPASDLPLSNWGDGSVGTTVYSIDNGGQTQFFEFDESQVSDGYSFSIEAHVPFKSGYCGESLTAYTYTINIASNGVVTACGITLGRVDAQ